MTEKSKIKELEKKIKKLEQEVVVQKALIDVLKSFPENKDKQVLSKKGKTKNAVSKRTQGKSGSKASSITSRQPEDHGLAVRGEHSNSEVMEKRD